MLPADDPLDGDDAERHAQQAESYAQMRLLLQKWRDKQESPLGNKDAPEDFMGIAAAKSDQERRTVPESQPPWFVMRPHLENAVLRLHEELLDFFQFMKHTNEDIQARRQWVRTIASAARTMWPQCQIRVFGSFATGLSLPNGDVDVALSDVPCLPSTAMKMLADHMLERGEVSWLEIIESAKVPVVKLRSQACGLRADVVINRPDGVETSKFVREQLREFPQMKPLIVFLKYFLLQRGLHETYTGGMGSYLLCTVVLHFIQSHSSVKNSNSYSATSLGHLIFDFFKYYGQEFRYDSTGIAVADGGSTFSKSERGWGGKGSKGGKKGGSVQLCVESPLDPQVDLGAACFRMPLLKNLFNHGFHCLCHLFVTRGSAEASMLCPLLLDSLHPVITTRHRLMAEQPVALPGLFQSSEPISSTPDTKEIDETVEPPEKRSRTEKGSMAERNAM